MGNMFGRKNGNFWLVVFLVVAPVVSPIPTIGRIGCYMLSRASSAHLCTPTMMAKDEQIDIEEARIRHIHNWAAWFLLKTKRLPSCVYGGFFFFYCMSYVLIFAIMMSTKVALDLRDNMQYPFANDKTSERQERCETRGHLQLSHLLSMQRCMA